VLNKTNNPSRVPAARTELPDSFNYNAEMQDGNEFKSSVDSGDMEFQ
jgi:hypothetical protein